MHSFAKKLWEENIAKTVGREKFKTFTILPALLKANVSKEDIKAYYYLLKIPGKSDQYIPKLNWKPPTIHLRTPSRTPTLQTPMKPSKRSSLRVQNGGSQVTKRARNISRTSPAVDTIKNLTGEHGDLELKIRKLTKELEKAKSGETQKREIFTKQFHCDGSTSSSLKNYFGLTNDYDCFVALVCSLHFEVKLKEAHSQCSDPKLTDFEACLMAKWYVYHHSRLLASTPEYW